MKIPAGDTLVVETMASPGTDEAIHIVDAWGGAALAYGAWPSPLPSLISASVEYENTSSSDIFVHVVVRSEGSPGQAQIIVNGELRPDPIPVGGTLLNADGLQDEPGGFLELVGRPGGSEWPAVMLFNDFSAKTPTWVGLQGGAAGNTRAPWDTDTRAILVGTPHYRAFDGTLSVARPGSANLYVNDKDDFDADGVGDMLEDALGMCNGTLMSAFECRYATTSIDSDRDGLPDGEELLGQVDYATQDVAWPRWGADPTHKDAFFVVTWVTSVTANAASNYSPFDPWDPSVAPGSLGGWLSEVIDPYAQGPASHLGNPDGQDGISIHLNIGLDPPASDEHIYGVWHDDVVHAVQEPIRIDVTGKIIGLVAVDVALNGGLVHRKLFDASGLDPLSLAAAIQAAGEAAVDGDIVGTVSFDASVPAWSVVFDAATEGDTFTIRVLHNDPTAPIFGSKYVAFSNGAARAHEDDTAYVPRELARRTRFAIISAGGQADQGRFVSRLGFLTFRHELGHTLGLGHHGHSQWQFYDQYLTSGPNPALYEATQRHVALNCMPHYRSFMNYAFEHEQAVGLSEVDSPIVFNEGVVSEVHSFPGMQPTDFSGAPWSLATSAGSVDWNRDSQLPLGVLEGVAPRFAHGISECWPFHVGVQALRDSGDVARSAALTRLDDLVFAVYVDGAGAARVRHASVGPTASSGCTGTEDVFDLASVADDIYYRPETGCLSWSTETSLGASGVDSIDAYAFDGSVSVALQYGDRVEIRRYPLPGDGPPSTSQVLHAGAATGRPALGEVHASSASGAGWTTRHVVVFAESTTDEYVAYYWEAATGSWLLWIDFAQAVSGVAGPHRLSGGGDPALVSWPDVHNAAFPADNRMACAIFPDMDRGMRPYCFDPVGLIWTDVSDDVYHTNGNGAGNCDGDWVWNPDGGAAGRCIRRTGAAPSLSFRYVRDGEGLPLDALGASGMLVATWTSATSDRTTIGMSAPISAAAGSRPNDGGWRWSWVGPFKNPSHTLERPGSVDLLEDIEIGATWAVTTDSVNSTNMLLFLPNADGSVDHDMYVASDFRVIEDYLCRWIQPHKIAGAVSDPVACTNLPDLPHANVFVSEWP